jgi:DNA polymerase/3'-5' exonuclease PolX
MALFVRTGPAEWNVRAMQRFIELGLRGHAYGGVTMPSGYEVGCPTEEAVFALLEWQFVEPKDRR